MPSIIIPPSVGISTKYFLFIFQSMEVVEITNINISEMKKAASFIEKYFTDRKASLKGGMFLKKDFLTIFKFLSFTKLNGKFSRSRFT